MSAAYVLGASGHAQPASSVTAIAARTRDLVSIALGPRRLLFSPATPTNSAIPPRLSLEQRTRRTVASMDGGVAVLARPPERLHRLRAAEYCAVAKAMTFGTYPRPRHFQQIFVGAAMRIVAAQAILPHRRMLEQ